MEYKIREKLFGANKRSASGTSLTLNDTVKYPINKLTIDGVCEQKTTTGKNLLDLSNLTSRVWNGITITRREDGSYSFSGTATNSTSFTLPLNLTLSPGAYTFSLETVQGFLVRLEDENNAEVFKVNDNKKSVTVTLSEEKQIKRLYFWASSGSTYNKDVFPQLEQGSQATYFESYTGKQPSPSPDFSQNISVLTGNIKLTSCGKNLVNPTTATFTRNGVTFTKNDDGTYTLNGTSTQSFDNNIISIQNKINVDKNNFYKLSLKVFSGTCSGGNLSSNVNLIINNNSTWNWLSTNNVAKQPTDNGYIGFVNLYVIKNIIFNDYRIGIQLEVVENSSSPSTDYEPYQGSSLNKTIPSNEFVGKLDDTYKDTLNVVYKDDGHYHLILNKMVGKIVLNGNENWDLAERTSNTNGIFYVAVPSLGINVVNRTNACSNYAKYFLGYSNKVGQFDIHYSQFRFFAPTRTITIEDWKKLLASNNLEIYFIIEKPYTIDLGIVDQLLTFDEITNIFTDSDLYPVINVKYYNGSLDISNYEFSIKEV